LRHDKTIYVLHNVETTTELNTSQIINYNRLQVWMIK